jgi:hypothetical protein
MRHLSQTLPKDWTSLNVEGETTPSATRLQLGARSTRPNADILQAGSG